MRLTVHALERALDRRRNTRQALVQLLKILMSQPVTRYAETILCYPMTLENVVIVISPLRHRPPVRHHRTRIGIRHSRSFFENSKLELQRHVSGSAALRSMNDRQEGRVPNGLSRSKHEAFFDP